jgi:hypothetical protein
MGKALIIIGIVFIAAGLLIYLLPTNTMPRLPGDIHIHKDNYSFYFPLGWSVLISVVASLAWWLFGK